jgi:hypothetical protein
MIDNQLRSVLFRVPVSGNPDCLDGPTLPQCFNGVVDLGAIDLQRGRDHGMPTYNQMRNAYGLSSKSSFTAITGESTDAFPAGLGVDSPQCNDIIALFDIDGNPTTVANDNAVRIVKRCTLAARLKAIYGSVSNVDAFAGMLAEPHVSGTELGQLQLAIWKDQFGALRDGDRFFYANDALQSFIRSNFRIDSRVTLAQVITRNSDLAQGQLPTNVFRLPRFQAAGITADGSAQAEPAPSATTRHDNRTKTSTDTPPATTPTRTGPRALHARRRRVH